MDVIGEGSDHTYLLFGDQVLGLRDAKDGETFGGVDHIAFRVSEWTGLRSRVGRARVTITVRKSARIRGLSSYGVPKGFASSSFGGRTLYSHSCSHPHPPMPPAPDPEE